MKVCHLEYFKDDYGKLVCLPLVMGLLSILSAYELELEYNIYHSGTGTFEFSFTAIVAICILLSIALSYLMTRNFQGWKIKLPLILIMTETTFFLVLAGIIVSVPLLMGEYIAFAVLLSICLLICSPFLIQVWICLEFFKLARMRNKRISNEEEESNDKELVVIN